MKHNFVAVITGKAKASTRWLFGLFLALPLLMQNDAFKNLVTPLLAAHPKAASAFGSITALALLLHDPKVQQVLGIGEITTLPTPATVIEPPTK
jgi:hypothetical protein